MKSKLLGVNIDHVATIRNARGGIHPSPLRAAQIATESGADSITIHLREDRRHITDKDLKDIKRKIKIPINLEIAPTSEMLRIACFYKPDSVCIVPEKRTEITTEGGLNVKKNKFFIKKMIKKLNLKKIKVSLFIEPRIEDVKISKEIGAKYIEIHTGKYCNCLNLKKKYATEYKKIKKAARYADNLGLKVNAGHGLTYRSAYTISRIKFINEFNIGHFIISESIFFGLRKIIMKFKKIINK